LIRDVDVLGPAHDTPGIDREAADQDEFGARIGEACEEFVERRAPSRRLTVGAGETQEPMAQRNPFGQVDADGLTGVFSQAAEPGRLVGRCRSIGRAR
jgi:hypothetical protein